MRAMLSCLALGAWLLVGGGPARAQAPEEFSGMATFGPHALLVVSDAKGDSPDPRVGILSLSGKAPVVLPVAVDDWRGKPASDLEACCPVPGSPTEFLLAESGWFKNGGGRVFLLKVSHDPDRGWVGVVGAVCRPFPAPADGSTSSSLQVEGMGAVATPEGRRLLVLGLRGGPEAAGRLVWGYLEGEDFRTLGQREFSLHGEVPDGRSCGDLQLVADSDGYRILSVAATDPGDLGPFRSAVCEVGRLTFSPSGPDIRTTAPRVLWRLEGLKVEALAPSPRFLEGSTFCIGTDDEKYGGIFRPLP